ncbi:hypothetical protein GF386_04660, partial [Candidatus Pacearchaeota archaeon]|nr:hypothetical protein [Candidatus Pacearchaeota archaeon]MBD3283408.1 hypothetical protein [Candidatus Pacearchaeota archaeon]
MKKVMIVLFILLILIIPFITAQDSNDTDINNTDTEVEEEVEQEIEEEIDEKTEEEVEEMETSHGAKMRLLQLERAIRRMVLYMQAVVNVLEQKGENVNEFNSLIEEMELLIEELQEVSAKADQESVDAFVRIKKDARDIVKKFRELARPLLTAEDKQDLIDEFKNINREQLKELTKQIHEQRRLRNAEKVEKLLERMGAEDEEFIDNIKNG